MCTCITYKNGDFYFGRNLDLECGFGEKVVITPRKYRFDFREEEALDEHYAMIGMAAVSGGYPLYAEAVNEKGLCMAGLNFPLSARYNEKKDGASNIAPYELIPWVLGQCESVRRAGELLEDLNLLDMPFSETMPLAPLHWMVADREECITVEAVSAGTMVYENPFGILTNEPEFPYYRDHISTYMNLTAAPPENRFAEGLGLSAYGQGLGAVGLPGDCSPVSRFVRGAFLKWNSKSDKNEGSNVSQFFHILEGVAMTRGSVITGSGNDDITVYSCCVNADRGIYYYRTYENSRVSAVRISEAELDDSCIKEFELLKEQDICWQEREESHVQKSRGR